VFFISVIDILTLEQKYICTETFPKKLLEQLFNIQVNKYVVTTPF